MRSIDDFVVYFQSQADAQRFARALGKRLAQFALALAPTNPCLGAFGRFAERDATRDGKRRETFTCLGFPLYCPRNRQGNCKVGGRTDKARLRRRLAKFHQLLQIMRHAPLKEQAEQSNQGLRGHYASYGVAGNVGSLLGVSTAMSSTTGARCSGVAVRRAKGVGRGARPSSGRIHASVRSSVCRRRD